jgi:hypothetical protein
MSGDYEFHSKLTIEEMLPLVNAVGPWVWHFRDSDSEGFYLTTSADQGKTRLRISEHGAGYLFEITLYPSEQRALARDALHEIVRHKILPAIHATEVRAI